MLHNKQNIFKEDVKYQNKQPLRKVYLMTGYTIYKKHAIYENI